MASGYRKIDEVPIAGTPDGTAAFENGQAVAFEASKHKTLGFYGRDTGSAAPSNGRVPAFLGLAERTGGVYLENPPSVREALERTHLDFQVEMLPHITERVTITDDGVTTERVELPHKRTTTAVFRDGRPSVGFESVSPGYTPVQNADGLSMGENIAGGSLVALGAFGQPVGARTYAAFKLDEGLSVGGRDGNGDPYDLFVTVINSHDKSFGLTVTLAPIRLGCTNQTYATFGGKLQPKYSIRHTAGATEKVDEIRRALGLFDRWEAAFAGMAEELLATQMNVDAFMRYQHKVLMVPDDQDQLTPRQRQIVKVRDEELLQILHGQTNAFGEGTAYAGYNAMVEYSDFASRVKGGDGGRELTRMTRIMSGQTEKVKDRAWALAMAAA